MAERKNIILIGYSGHAFVVADTFVAAGRHPVAYCDLVAKENNPFKLKYLGPESGTSAKAALLATDFFVAVGDNRLRQKITNAVLSVPVFCVHPTAHIGIGAAYSSGVMIGAKAVVNPLSVVSAGAIINTGAIVEHECLVGRFAHVGPGAVLAGNVSVGEGAFVGAGAVVKQGITIGEWATVGAGAVVIRDVPPGATVVGNPARVLRSETT